MNIKNKTSFSKGLLCACILLGTSINIQASDIEREFKPLTSALQRLGNNLTEAPEELLVNGGRRLLRSAAEGIDHLAGTIRPLSRSERFVRWINRTFERITQCFRR